MAKTKTREPKPCLCGCGEMTGGGDFRPGHDARYKSALIRRALQGDEEATQILEDRNWTKFLDKAKTTPPRRTAEEATEIESDGLPNNATRPDEIDQDTFIESHICSGRQVVIRRNIRGMEVEEVVRFKSPFLLAIPKPDGKGYRMKRIEPDQPPLIDGVLRLTCAETGGKRDIRYNDVVGVLNR